MVYRHWFNFTQTNSIANSVLVNQKMIKIDLGKLKHMYEIDITILGDYYS